MKKLILILITLITVNNLFSQSPANTGGIRPPDNVNDSFTKNHPNVVPNWSKDGENFRAIYEDPLTHKGVLIIYNKQADVIRSEFEIDNADQPKPISDYYNKNYPQEKYKTWSTQDHTGVKTYYIIRNNEVMYFDKDGNYTPSKNK